MVTRWLSGKTNKTREALVTGARRALGPQAVELSSAQDEEKAAI